MVRGPGARIGLPLAPAVSRRQRRPGLRRPTALCLALLAFGLAGCQPMSPAGQTPAASGAATGASASTNTATGSAAVTLPGAVPELPSGVVLDPGSAADQMVAGMAGPMCKDDGGGAGAQAPLPLSVATAGADEPRLAVVELGRVLSTVVDVGTIPRDAASEHTFTLQNVGTGELKIEALSASCGCTKVETDTRTIAPGASTILHVVYDPTAAEDKGPTIEKKVRIKSNDKQRPFVEFTMTGTFAAGAGAAEATTVPTAP